MDIPVGYAARVTTLGARIKAVREAIKPKFNQGQLAEAMHVAQSAVSKWENDETRPDGVQLVRIAAVLKCSVEDLVVGVDDSYDRLRKKARDLPDHGAAAGSAFTRGGQVDVSSSPAQARVQQPDVYEKALQDVIDFASKTLVAARQRARGKGAHARKA